jgi:aspartate 1-decarboxylase
MRLTMLKSKIHRARVTATNLNYEGSLSLDKELMKIADILPYEQIEVVNLNSGARFTTYAIEGGKGEVCLNGAAARLAKKGDTVIIMTYAQFDETELGSFIPTIVHVNKDNSILAAGPARETGSLYAL